MEIYVSFWQNKSDNTEKYTTKKKKRLINAERAKFMDTRQEADKLVTKFLIHLKNAFWYCELFGFLFQV